MYSLQNIDLWRIYVRLIPQERRTRALLMLCWLMLSLLRDLMQLRLGKQRLVSQGVEGQSFSNANKTPRIAKSTKQQATKKTLADELAASVQNLDI